MVYGYKLYNEEFKKRFLEQYPKKTAKFYASVLARAVVYEKKLQKDMAAFNTDEIKSWLLSLGATSLKSLTTAVSVARQYTNFAIKERFVDKLVNEYNLFNRDTLRQYVSKVAQKKKYISKEEFEKLVNMAYNASDAVILQLLWEGVKGEGTEEIKNLRPEDVDRINNILTLRRDDGTTRKIKVSDKLIELIFDAYNEEKYYNNNGMSTQERCNYTYLANTGYIVRPAGKNKTGRVDDQVIQRRVRLLTRAFGNPFLTITNIWMSGLIEYAKQYMKEKGKTSLEAQDYMEICERYGYNKESWYLIKSQIEPYLVI